MRFWLLAYIRLEDISQFIAAEYNSIYLNLQTTARLFIPW